jgi:hypothetical protein
MLNLLYLGGYVQDNHTVQILRELGEFGRVTYLIKSTLDYTHIHMNPLPDVIILQCDWEDHELEWVKRYALEIPKIFVVCQDCSPKYEDYTQFGEIYNSEIAILQGDFYLSGLIDMIRRLEDNENKGF